jgi:hypothetical protein
LQESQTEPRGQRNAEKMKTIVTKRLKACNI